MCVWRYLWLHPPVPAPLSPPAALEEVKATAGGFQSPHSTLPDHHRKPGREDSNPAGGPGFASTRLSLPFASVSLSSSLLPPSGSGRQAGESADVHRGLARDPSRAQRGWRESLSRRGSPQESSGGGGGRWDLHRAMESGRGGSSTCRRGSQEAPLPKLLFLPLLTAGDGTTGAVMFHPPPLALPQPPLQAAPLPFPRDPAVLTNSPSYRDEILSSCALL
ncbi:hypothetical protein AAFF_G00096900 [Aldrovandia affinis]|uniref:Uncharacterized protein n=1 Tax=Aldrovandia affinis TaxID=143900 RepID=A0AAD7RVE1_9TELE|nr:hypothetical protein AAFF_G00096900 [Aldrovandia affinis]